MMLIVARYLRSKQYFDVTIHHFLHNQVFLDLIPVWYQINSRNGPSDWGWRYTAIHTIGRMTCATASPAVGIRVLTLTHAVGIRLFCKLFLFVCGTTSWVASGGDVLARVRGVSGGHW